MKTLVADLPKNEGENNMAANGAQFTLNRAAVEATLAMNPDLKQGKSINDTIRELQESLRHGSQDNVPTAKDAPQCQSKPMHAVVINNFADQKKDEYAQRIQELTRKEQELQQERKQLGRNLCAEIRHFSKMTGIQLASDTATHTWSPVLDLLTTLGCDQMDLTEDA
jgi:hypothetical protein